MLTKTARIRILPVGGENVGLYILGEIERTSRFYDPKFWEWPSPEGIFFFLAHADSPHWPLSLKKSGNYPNFIIKTDKNQMRKYRSYEIYRWNSRFYQP